MKKNTFKVLFYLRGNHVNKDGTCSIMIRISVDGEREQLNSKLVIQPELWDTARGRAIGRSAKINELNGRLDDIKVLLKEHYDEAAEATEIYVITVGEAVFNHVHELFHYSQNGGFFNAGLLCYLGYDFCFCHCCSGLSFRLQS